MKTIFSGIQPTGNLHIGNYLGAVRNWVDLQNSGEYDCYFCIVDLHSLDGNMSPADRKKNIVNMAAELLAAGIDPKKSTLFVQSHVPEHTELSWIFAGVTPVAELERMTQFKDKSARKDQNINTGLFTYPVLMAADILLYHAAVIPVGEDQVQHVELTRNVARWFTNRYGEYFKGPDVLLTEIPRVKSLLEPTSKMSKSKGENHVIELQDDPKTIERKLKKAVTASEGGGDNPGAQNLLLLLKEFGDAKVYEQFAAAEKDGSIRYGDLKAELSSTLSEHLAAFRERRAELLDNHDELAEILADGARRAQNVADKTMEKVRELVGIR